MNPYFVLNLQTVSFIDSSSDLDGELVILEEIRIYMKKLNKNGEK